MPISLENLLVEQQIVLELKAEAREEALREVAQTFFTNEAMLDLPAFQNELLAREKLQSTAAGNNVAFPHARSDAVEAIMLAIGRSPTGISFGKGDDTVQLIFLIGTPRKMVNDYLVCIGELSRLLKDGDLREDLMRAPTASEFVEILKRAAGPLT